MNNGNSLANGITEQVSGLSLNEKLDVRRETLLRSNKVEEAHAHNLLRAHDADEQHVSLKKLTYNLSNNFSLDKNRSYDEFRRIYEVARISAK